MIISLNQISTTPYKFCIVGAGPIGIILALELAARNTNCSILLLDFGGYQPAIANSLDQSIQVKNPVNHYPPQECSNKGLGGSSITWGGRCVQYDEIDFMSRTAIGHHSTWDLDLFAELKSYADKAAAYFQCGTGIFNLEQLSGMEADPIAAGFSSDHFIDTGLERWSLPIRFGKYYKSQLLKSANIHVLLNCECYWIAPPDQEGLVSSIGVKHVKSGEQKEVIAQEFILAAGGIESTRLLLKNPEVFWRLGHPPFALGRYYQGHLAGKIATVKFKGDPRSTEYGFRQAQDGTYLRRRLQLSTERLLEHNLLNTVLWLDNPPYFDPSHRSGVQSLMYLAMITPLLGDRLAPPSVANSVTDGKSNQVGQHLWNVIKDLPQSLTTTLATFFQRYVPSRKLPGVFLYNADNTYALYFQSEQIPSPDNRIEWSKDHETLVIHYTISEAEIDSVLRVHDLFALELQKNDCGQLSYWCPRDQIPALIRSQPQGGIHQIGTTRIGHSEVDGVVDRHLKLFGTCNFFVCSTSVLPTSGQANPTFVVGEFAVRLAHFLSQSGKT
jgi:GMC oxidoreductase